MLFIKRVNGVVVSDEDLKNMEFTNNVVRELLRDVNERIMASTGGDIPENESPYELKHIS